MSEFKILFDKKTNNEFINLYLNKALINKATNLIKLIFITKNEFYDEYNQDENIQKIKNACNEIFKDVNISEIIIRPSIINEEEVKKAIVLFLKKEEPIISDSIDFKSLNLKKIDSDIFEILVEADISLKKAIELSNIEKKLENHLCNEFAIKTKLIFNYRNITETEFIVSKNFEEAVYDSTVDKLKLNVRENIYRKFNSKYATKLKDLKTGTFPDACIAGTLTSLKNFKSKNKNKIIYNLDIEENSTIFNITIFTDLDVDGPPFTNLILKETYAFEGLVQYNEYKKKNTMIAKTIALVDIENGIKEDYFTNIIKEDYQLVRPNKFDLPNMKAATSIEDFLIVPKKENCPEVLKGKTFVVFDLETTGLNKEGLDKITEIAAIKIKDGKKVEIFETLINPEKLIPAEVSEKTGITNEMVQNKPTIGQVVHDFFKFIDGAALVGHNALGFDIPFLNSNVKNYRYKIKNNIPIYDTLLIARRTIQTPSREYRLEKLAEFLNVDLTNAHRAKYDTLATTEIFLYLANNYPDELLPS